jgi:Fe-S-cluster containining protein
LSVNFKCTQCGECCKRLTSTFPDGNDYGLYLSPDETHLFARETVFPLFRRGGEITAYQVGVNECPNLQLDGKCGIHDQRPLACRAYPIHDRGILRSDCKFISEHQTEEINWNSFHDELTAFNEQEAQAETSPVNEYKWPLNLRTWVEV